MLRRQIDANRFITLAPDQADYYQEQPDGTYLLQIVEPDGSLAPPPKAEEVAGLKSALAKAKGERDDTRNQLREVRAALAADNAPAAYRAVLEKRLEELIAREATNKAEYEKARAALAAEWEPKIAEADAKIAKSRAEHDGHLLDHTLEKTIHAQRGAVALLAPKLARYVKVIRDENGEHPRVAAFDTDGTLRTNPQTGELISVDQVLAELRAFDPALAVCFESSNGNGAH